MEMGHSLCFGAIGIETHGKWDKNIQNDSWAENPPPPPTRKSLYADYIMVIEARYIITYIIIYP